MHTSTSAYIALALVLPASVVAFAMLSVQRAVLLLLIGGMMFLPSGINFDPPLIPPLDKYSIPALCMLIGVLATSAHRVWSARPPLVLSLLIVIATAGVFGTTATNHDMLRYGPTKLQGLTGADTVSEVVSLLLGPIVPFMLGLTLFRTLEDAKDLLRAFVIAGLVYMPFVLVELRMSPQWHIWVYGYFPHSFAQTIRESGYRPQVFFNHGLVLALFLATSMIAAWTLVRANTTVLGMSARPLAWVLTGLLASIHSLGALIYGLIVAPLIRYLKPRTLTTIAATLSLIVIAYPVMRSADLIPVEEMVEVSERYSADRAESLAFRFKNEEVLLRKALERPFFGWGGWGRDRVFNKWGYDESIPDGLWVILMGSGGCTRFICEFGLILAPLFIARRRIGALDPESQTILGGLSMISIVHSIDLLPNAGCGYLFMFLPGVVAGLARGMATGGARRLDPQTALQVLLILRRAAARLGASGGDVRQPSRVQLKG